MGVELPWQADTILPESPSRETYGFLAGNKFRTCTRDELVQNCSAVQVPDIRLVWTPESARLVPMTEVPILQPALEARVRSAIGLSAFNIAVGLLMILLVTGSDGRQRWPFWTIFLVIPGLQSLADALTARRAVQQRGQQAPPWPRDAPARFAFWLSSQRSRITQALATAIAFVALCQLARGLEESVNTAGLVKDAVRQGELWRLFSAGMLHAHPWHLLGNLGALLALGRIVEVLAHWSRLAVVFLVSILCGSLFSMLLLPESTSVGASGGLMGLLGFLLVLGRRHARGLPPGFARSLIVGILWVAAAGVLAYAFIDNAAHLGGLLAGIGLGLVLVPRTAEMLPLSASPGLMRAGMVAGAGLLLTLLGCVTLLLKGV